MSQSKKYSWFETFANITVGFCVAYVGQKIIFPIVGLDVAVSQNLTIATFFTVVGIARIYIMRRVFNWLHSRGWN